MFVTKPDGAAVVDAAIVWWTAWRVECDAAGVEDCDEYKTPG